MGVRHAEGMTIDKDALEYYRVQNAKVQGTARYMDVAKKCNRGDDCWFSHNGETDAQVAELRRLAKAR
jgi:hypothetical protein